MGFPSAVIGVRSILRDMRTTKRIAFTVGPGTTAIICLGLAFATSLPARAAQLLPSVGTSQTFAVSLKFAGPKHMQMRCQPGSCGPTDSDGQMTITRTDPSHINLSTRDNAGQTNGRFSIDSRGLVEVGDMPNPILAAYNDAIALAARASPTPKVGDRWSATFEFPGPGFPPPPPGSSRAGWIIAGGAAPEGPVRLPGSTGVQVNVGFAPPIPLEVSVVSTAGSTIRLAGIGSVTQTMQSPDGKAHFKISIHAEETIVAGRLAVYTESITNTVNGPPGSIKMTTSVAFAAR
jgi:hypothetical protein